MMCRDRTALTMGALLYAYGTRVVVSLLVVVL